MASEEGKLGEKLKSARLLHGLTLEQVAKRVGVDRATVLRWERGEIKSIKGNRLSELAACLGLPVSELIGGDGYAERDGIALPLSELSDGALRDTGECLYLPASALPDGVYGLFLYRVTDSSDGYLPGDLLILRPPFFSDGGSFLMPDGSVCYETSSVPEGALAGVVGMHRYFKI